MKKNLTPLFFLLLLLFSCGEDECPSQSINSDLTYDYSELASDSASVMEPFQLNSSVRNNLYDAECGETVLASGDTQRRLRSEYRSEAGEPWEETPIKNQSGELVDALFLEVTTLGNGENDVYQDEIEFSNPGQYAFFQKVDPMDVVTERDENNNDADSPEGGLKRQSRDRESRVVVITVLGDGSEVEGDPVVQYLGTKLLDK